jgi:S-disulfanyl-L-cysteine oxidoreductase SoxD
LIRLGRFPLWPRPPSKIDQPIFSGLPTIVRAAGFVYALGSKLFVFFAVLLTPLKAGGHIKRLIPLSRRGFRCVPGAALCGYALFGALLLTGQAPPVRSITEGVYSVGQAARGQQLYQAQCAACHGKAMEGTIGSPLAGDSFLSNWSARSLANLVDKIQKTMPFNLPGSLSRQQSTDLGAYILQGGKVPAGEAELTEAALAQIVFPTVRSSATPSVGKAAAISLPPPEGNLAELMRAIAFPNANIIFNVQLKDPGAQAKKQPAAAPFDYVEWGSTIYPGWLAIDHAAVALTETAPLLLTPGRRCQNGRAVPVDRADWKQYVAGLVEVGKLARKASQARNYEAFVDISEKLNDACANCHKVYRDKGGTEGSGATRCQPAPEEK